MSRNADNNISIRGLYKTYDKLNVLENINFEVEKRKFVSIVGPSGCGKSTLLKIIGGLISDFSGRVLIKNDDIDSALQKHKLGFMFQKPVLLPWRNVEGNIILPLEITGGSIDHAAIKNILDLVDLSQFSLSYPNELSGGMQQRVAIARALVYKPSILLMDEPFGALDEITRNKMGLELLKIWEHEKTPLSNILFVTHSLIEAVFLSDEVVVLSDRPAKVKNIVNINLPRPRVESLKFSNTFIELTRCIQTELNTNI